MSHTHVVRQRCEATKQNHKKVQNQKNEEPHTRYCLLFQSNFCFGAKAKEEVVGENSFGLCHGPPTDGGPPLYVSTWASTLRVPFGWEPPVDSPASWMQRVA